MKILNSINSNQAQWIQWSFISSRLCFSIYKKVFAYLEHHSSQFMKIQNKHNIWRPPLIFYCRGVFLMWKSNGGALMGVEMLLLDSNVFPIFTLMIIFFLNYPVFTFISFKLFFPDLLLISFGLYNILRPFVDYALFSQFSVEPP